MKKILEKNGSALAAVIVLSSAFSLVTGSLLNQGVTEHRITDKSIAETSATNGAEALAEYGVAQLVRRWETQANFNADELASDNNPITITSSFNALMESRSVDTSTLEISGSNISNPYWVYLDPDDPANENDPDKGKSVHVRDVTVFTKASEFLKSTPVDAFSSKTLQIRDIPVFSHVAFYNMDLEMHPGPQMTMKGPVHANGNIYTNPRTQLYFDGTVSTAKGYYHKFPDNHYYPFRTGQVYFKDRTGNWKSDYKGEGSLSNPINYYDSSATDWNSKSNELWGGNVTTGVKGYKLLGFDDYVRDNPTTATVDDALNHAYALIEPNLKVLDKLNHPYHKGAQEELKYARRAGLIIRIGKMSELPATPTMAPTTLTDAAPEKTLPTHAYKLSDNYYVQLIKLSREDQNNPNSPALTENDMVKEVAIEVDDKYIDQLLKVKEYEEGDDGHPDEGIWDARRGQGVDIVEMNIDELRKGIDTQYFKYKSKNLADNYDPAKDYNGIVYVEFPITGTETRPDQIVKSQDGLGLLVKNAENVPNSIHGDGFTLATNNAMYVKGSFNADGKENTGSSTEADSAVVPEPPAALAADAITLLSDDWDHKKSKMYKTLRPAKFTEINAALISGVMPTDKGGNGSVSGGNHNFPRLLEDWTGVTLRYRGSMSALYESEVATQRHSEAYYGAPTRDWGYYSEFKKGKFPPGSPVVRTFRKTGFRKLKRTVYEETAPIMTGNLTVSTPPTDQKKGK